MPSFSNTLGFKHQENLLNANEIQEINIRYLGKYHILKYLWKVLSSFVAKGQGIS